MKNGKLKQEIQDWIEAGCDYDSGVAIYVLHGKNEVLKKTFNRKNSFATNKLIYELSKLAGLDFQKIKVDLKLDETEPKVIPFVPVRNEAEKPAKKDVKVDESKDTQEKESLPEMIEVKNIAEYPSLIRMVISEYAEVFQERSKTHRIMTEMPEGNSQALKTKRAELFSLVKSLTDRLVQLYEVREKYEADGLVPDEEEIWPKPKEKAITELPDDPDQLRKMKKNQQSANTKDQNLLDFQTEKKSETSNPMPSGPKRMKIENRIKARIKMIEEIDFKLVNKIQC